MARLWPGSPARATPRPSLWTDGAVEEPSCGGGPGAEGSAEIARRAFDHREPLLARLERCLRLGDLLRIPSGDRPVVLLLLGGDGGMQLRGRALDACPRARIGAAPFVLLGVLDRTLHGTQPVIDPAHVTARDLARLLPTILDGAQRRLRGLQILRGIDGLRLGQ